MPDKTAHSAHGHMGGSAPMNGYRTKPQRRKALNRIVLELETIKAAEEHYLENASLSQQCSDKYEIAEQNVGILEEALSVLTDIFD